MVLIMDIRAERDLSRIGVFRDQRAAVFSGKEADMLTIMQTATLCAPAESADVSPEIRFEDSPAALSLEPSRYSSVLDDALADNAIHKYKDKLRRIALHPVKLHAGQSAPSNGGIGRFASPQVPEIIGGGLVGINL